MKQSNIPPSKLYLWEDRTLYLGTISEPIRFVQPASSIAFSLDKPVKLYSKNISKTIETRSFILPPGEIVTCDTKNAPMAVCMLDPLGYDYAAMAPLMGQQVEFIKFDIENEETYIDAFKTLYYEDISAETAYIKLDKLLISDAENNHIVDPRIVKVLELIQHHVEDNVSIDVFAKEIGVSVPRLVQLFREQVGAPIRRYRLWHRLFCATREIARTQNLSAGALSAGFADTAHFNRTFRRMLGMTPTSLLLQPNGLKIYVPS